jgi:hypothetical protein
LWLHHRLLKGSLFSLLSPERHDDALPLRSKTRDLLPGPRLLLRGIVSDRTIAREREYDPLRDKKLCKTSATFDTATYSLVVIEAYGSSQRERIFTARAGKRHIPNDINGRALLCARLRRFGRAHERNLHVHREKRAAGLSTHRREGDGLHFFRRFYALPLTTKKKSIDRDAHRQIVEAGEESEPAARPVQSSLL